MTTGRKITGLPLPETPREAPPEIHGLVEAIEVTLADSDAMEAAQVLGRTFEYLTRYFAGAAGAIAQHLGLPGDPSVALDFGEARKQLQDRMEALGDQATDVLSKLVRGVFYVGATRKAPTPRRHARLLDLGGIPIRGYRNIDEWIAIEPGTGDLSNESKANRELLRYLPILKEWLTATATYFLDVKQSELHWETPNELHFSFEAEGVTLKVGPIHLPEPLAALLPRDYRGLSAAESAPPEPRPAATPPVAANTPPEPPPPTLAAPQAKGEPLQAEPLSTVPSFEPIAPVTAEPPAAPDATVAPAVAPLAMAEGDIVVSSPIPVFEPISPAQSEAAEKPAALTPPVSADAIPAETAVEPVPIPDQTPSSQEPPTLPEPPLAVEAPVPSQEPPGLAEPPASAEAPEPPAATEESVPQEPVAVEPREPEPVSVEPEPVSVEPDVPPASASSEQPLSETPAVSDPFAAPPAPVSSTVPLSELDLSLPDIDDFSQSAAVVPIPVFEPIGVAPPEPPVADDNPFAAPAQPLSGATMALRPEDLNAFLPSADPVAPEPPAAPPVQAQDSETAAQPPAPAPSDRDEPAATSVAEPIDADDEDDDFDDEDDDKFESRFDDGLDDDYIPRRPVPDDDDELPMEEDEELELPPAAAIAESPEPAGAAASDEPVEKGARVKPVLPFQKEKEEKAVPQINVAAPLQLYPVVTGPPPEFFDEIPVDADYPEVLQTALTDLNGAIEANDSLLICGQMQRCFDLMIQFFAGIAGAVLLEISSDYLREFEIEDGRFDLQEKLELVVSALSSLEEYWEGNDAATLIWSVFYDTLLPATDPNSAYLHTRLLGVEGSAPEGFLEFSDLCSVVPGQGALAERSACRETAHRYLPILAFWLENATPLFLESEVDFVEEGGGEALSWAASIAGATLDGTPSGFWLEVSASRWNLPRPELAPVFVVGDAPDVLLPVIDELNASLEKKNFARAGLMVRVGLDFLIQYFAGCAGALWRDQGEMSEQAEELYCPEASLEEKERLLLLSLSSLHADTAVGSSLGKLFSKSSLQYRALIRRDLPAGMGPVAEWASRRDEIGESNLLVYLPLLRSWLGAANPWFAAGEQLFEEPADDGRLEGVVAFGDHFLEMVDPEYVIRLAPEVMELIAPLMEAEREAEAPDERREFTGMLPAMPILTSGPPLLIGHLGRLLEAGDDRRAANAWIGSAFEYLIQYFAGLCVTVLGGKEAPLRKTVMPYFSPKASLREREVLLVEAIGHLKDNASAGTQTKIKTIFFTEDGKLRPHTRYLGAAGPGSLSEDEMLLSFWCRARHKTGTLNTQEYHWAMSALTSWVDAAKPFFADCEHYAEDPGPDGQEEMVVELAEDYLDMVLPDYAIQIPARGYYEVLYRETDAVASDEAALFFPDDVRPELLGPKTTELGGISDDSGELLLGAATVELGGDDFFAGAAAFNSDDLFTGAAPKPKVEEKPAIAADSPYAKKQRTGNVNLGSAPDKPATPAASEAPKEPMTEEELAEAENEAGGRRRKKKRAKKAELGNAVLELYKKERLEKARKRAEARARKEEAEPTKLAYKLTYKGLKNSKQLGGRCHFGLIELSNAGGGELKGTVEPSHPSVKVQPSRFEGNEVRVVYQIDPSDMPSTGRVGISLNTQDERIELRMERLVPTNWWRERPFSHALALMAAPALVYGVTLLWLVALLMGPGLEMAFNAMLTSKVPLAFGVKFKLWIFAVLAILPGATGVPALVKVMFSRFDFTVQEESRKVMPLLMMLPTLIMALTLYLTPFWTFATPLARLPILATKHWLVVLTLGINLLAAALFSTQTTVWWEDNSDTVMARRAFGAFWIATVALGVVATFVMSIK